MSEHASDVDYEAVHWIREACKDVTGTNCTFVDDDLKVLAHLAKRAVQAGLIDGLPRSIQAIITSDNETGESA